MRNLHADIVEMFAGLDGSDRYEDARERWSASHTSLRYQRDPEFRERHKAAVDRYKDLVFGVDRPRRHRRPFGPIAIKHGVYSSYTKYKCRCTACRSASAAYRRRRRSEIAVGAA